ncbi:SDR family NAD(P)-dependent oxidoreductase [Microbacterium sp. No. 7]|uniref:SDR family NAD(P)-dependent oxidoreductase n=1 Tax=Microbacterium sp. No. 7 TaxID=1714373 RepID=UPI0006CFC8FF|nr:SDR family oxidoreductase [Microbacterium sp. No. 7]ALJ20853.1 short-chain dehydrogenase [Microbacterium sp. No. 7]
MTRGTAIVTGGAGNIGLAIATALRDDGWSVRIVDRAQALDGFTAPEGLHADALDVTDAAACRAYFASLEELSVLVNCAGIAQLGLVRDLSEDDWDAVLDVNLTAPFRLTQLAVDLLVRSGHGSIVNITSIAGQRASFGRVAYGVSKAGLLQLTRQTAVEYAPLGVRCNSVSPGPVNSELARAKLTAEALAEYLDDIPEKRLAEPEEIARAVVFLASPTSTHITGQDIAVDGGFLAGGAGIRQAQRLGERR